MTMAEQNLVSHLLDGMVHCRKCNTTMTTAGGSFGETPKYVCPSSSEGCDTPEIPTEPFNRVVVESVIRAALAGENIKRVSEIVQENAEKQYPEFLTESFIFNPKTFTSAPELYLLALDPERHRIVTGPEAYARSLRRLRQYWTITGDTGHIEGYALDLDTYLRPSNILTTRTIMDTAVDEIRVGPRSATIRYKTPMPPGSGAEGRSQEEVDLPS